MTTGRINQDTMFIGIYAYAGEKSKTIVSTYCQQESISLMNTEEETM